MSFEKHATVIQIADDFIASIAMRRDPRGLFIDGSHLLPYQHAQNEMKAGQDSGESFGIELALERLLDGLGMERPEQNKAVGTDRKKPNKITLVLPTKRALFRDLIIPKLPPRALDSAIALEIGESIPFPIGECFWGYKVIPHGDSKVRIVASILPKKPLKNIIGALKNLGAEIDKIYLSAHASIVSAAASAGTSFGASAKATYGSMSTGYTVDELKSTSICIIHKNSPIITRVIPKEENHEERLRQEIVLTGDYIRPVAVKPDDFVHLKGMIRRESIRSSNKHDIPLNPVRLSEAVISKSFACDTGTYSESVSPSDEFISSALIGGGLAALGYSDIPIDLASIHPPKERLKDKVLRHLTFNAAAIILSILILFIAFGFNIARMNSELSSINSLIPEAERYARRSEALQLQSAELSGRIRYLEEEFGRNTVYLELLQEISSLLPEGAAITSVQMEGNMLKQLKGYGRSARDVLDALERSRFLENIRLLSPITPDRDGKGESFSVSAVIKRSEVNGND